MRRIALATALALALARPAFGAGALNVRANLLGGDFAPGQGLVAILVSAHHAGAGAGYQLFNGLQGNGPGTGLWVDPADAAKIQIRQVSYLGEAVSTEAEATARDGSGGYVKADDTWFYEPYVNFLSGPTADDPEAWQFAATRPPGDGRDLDGFLHLVLWKTSAYDGSEARVYLGGKWGLVGGPAEEVTFRGLIALAGASGPEANERLGVIAVRRIGGDANSDGDVDFTDYQALERHFGLTGGATWGDGDFNADGNVDFTDYQVLERHFGTGVPEPTGLALVALGGAAAALFGRRGPVRKR